MTLIKICGITNLDDARAAVEAGADWLGLIFVPQSPRYLPVEPAYELVQAIRAEYPNVAMVGVFQDSFFAVVEAHIDVLKLDMVQLHGSEPSDYCQALSVPVIKTLVLSPDDNPETLLEPLAAYQPGRNNIQALLVDMAKQPGVPSLAEAPDAWRLPLTGSPFLVAGRLTPQNVWQALERFRPTGVDVASGVETAPGHKDAVLMQAFCQAVRQFDRR